MTAALRLTYAMRQRAPITLILGRKSGTLKRDIRRVVRDVGKETRDLARFLSPVKTGRMQRLLKLTFTPARFGFDVGWRARDFRREGVVFYVPFVVEGTSRQVAQDPISPAFRHTTPRLQRECTLVFRKWAKTQA